jgi:hypothetical protein
VNFLALDEELVAVGCEGAAEGEGGVEGLAVLVEGDDAEVGGAGDGAGVGLEVALEKFQQRGFAGAVGAEEAEGGFGGEGQGEVAEERPLFVGC